MPIRTFIRSAALIAALIFIQSLSLAQASRPDFNRRSNIDVQHYTLRISFEPDKKRVIGDTMVRVKPLENGFRQLILDSVGIAYTSVVLEPVGTALKFRAEEGKVIVDLDRAYSANEQFEVRFRYSATPKKGVYFVPEQKAEGDMPGHSAQIWTQGEPDEARHWFPSFDFPSDKATVEQFITASKGETVVGNGRLIDAVDNPDGTTTHHFKMDVSFSTYLVSFVIGQYAKKEERYKDISLGFYVYPGTESIIPKAYGRTSEMMRTFEQLTGVAYPYPKYDQTIVSAFQFGGMENITATTMADTEIFLANSPLFEGTVVDLVSHELAHSWFGDLVTCRNWAELWLNEGFATFMEASYREKIFGRRGYIIKVQTDADSFMAEDSVSRNRYGLFNRTADAVDKLFEQDGTTYNKGGAVLHMLREQVGNDAFWKAVNIYLNRHKYGNVESTDLKAAMEEVSGQDLGWFFDQWVYGLGYPKITVKQSYNARTKSLTLTFTQTQKQDKFSPASFRLPLDVSIESAGSIKDEQVNLVKRVETFTYKLSSRPTKLLIDRESKVPIKAVKVLKLGAAK